MRNTLFQDDNTRIIKNRAFSYIIEDGILKNQIMRYDLVGSGGIYSNIRDLYLWDQNFYHNKLGKGSQVLIEKMHKDGVLNNGSSSGYAFAIQNGIYRGLKTVSHGGALASYRSYLLRFPDQKLSVIILGNVTPIPIGRLPFSVADIMLEKQLAPLSVETNTASAANKPQEVKIIPVKDVKQYAGNYYSEELDVTYQIIENNTQLLCSIKNKKPFL
jgi:CubicO group peptidase (beta-lactamase class C family)